MERQTTNRCGLPRILILLQILLGSLIVLVGLTTLHHLNSATTTLHAAEACLKFNTITEGYADFDLQSLSDRVTDVLFRLSDLQDKLDFKLDSITKSKKNNTSITRSEFRRFLDEDVVQPLYAAHIALRLIRIPKPATAAASGGSGSGSEREDPLINFFNVEEIRKYITGKPNRGEHFSIYGTNKTYGAIGHACVLMRAELEEYMNYDVGSYCRDDWHLAEKLMLGGCDPLPRRRCLARAPKLFQRPLPVSKSLWSLPDDNNVRWSHYTCRSYKCLQPANPRRGFSKCASCFDMGKEKLRWVTNATKAEFLISEVLAVKPGEVRIGLDVSVSTGSFAARMRENGVTVVSTAMNLGAPFSETIALRGVVPIYTTLSQRLPFFDNTMDLIHTSEFLSGWVDMQLLDFVLFDWDRVLRPGGLLWVDRFHCSRKDLDDYMYMFLQFRYKKHKWVVSFRSKEEVYLSALLEKPPRSL